MKYEPKTLVNNTNHDIEFMCGGITYIHKAGLKKPYDGKVAYHALNRVNTGLEEYVEGEGAEKPKKTDDPKGEPELKVAISRKFLMDKPWKELLKMMGKKFRPGMNKEQVVDILMNG